MEEDNKKSTFVIAIVALIIGIIALGGFVILLLVILFRRYPTGVTRWAIVEVSGDQGNSATATITPGINVIYFLSSGITSVILNTPTVNNYGGTTFMIRVSDVGIPVNVTPPSGVTLRLQNKLTSGAGATFLWSENTTILYVV